MRFSVNVSILFTEVPFLERFACVRDEGFTAVEFWWPHGENLAELEQVITANVLDVALFNFDAGDMSAGDRGLLADPARADVFRDNVPVALDLAERLNCRRLNALVGLRLPGVSRGAQLALARDNLRYAADRAAERGIDVLVEAVNTYENGPYLLSSTPEAVAFIHDVSRPNVRLQYDAYHMRLMGEDIAATITRHIGEIAHIQIADAPGRGQPGTGAIDYEALFPLIDRLGYGGYVGLEYRPVGDTRASLAWLPRAERSADSHTTRVGSSAGKEWA